MPLAEKKLTALLLASRLVKEEDIRSAADEAERLGETVPQVLVGRGLLTDDYFAQLFSGAVKVPIVDLKRLTLSREIITRIPEEFAKSHGVVVFEDDPAGHIVKVAMLDPLDYETIEFLRVKLDRWVEPYLTTPESLQHGLRLYDEEIGREFSELIAENVKKVLGSGGETDITKLAEAVPVARILEGILEHAVALGASDAHFEPLRDALLVRFRIDGILREIKKLHKTISPILVARVKILAGLRLDEHHAPQDGRFRYETASATEIDIRVSVMPTMHGEKVEMRVLRSAGRALALTELGIDAKNIAIIEEEIHKPHGMILATGPTGHGKTTTLYSLLHMLNTPQVNIVTVEDPIEYEIARVNQTQVNVKAGVTFATGLRAIVRQNPDIILVGEIRDSDTVEIAIHAALTGQLVLSTLHTNDAPSTFPRLIDMGAQPFLVASTINITIAQRLVRRICRNCIVSYETPEEVKRLIAAQLKLRGDDGAPVKPPIRLFRGQGCAVCGQAGFSGQIGIFEILRVSDTIRTLVTRLATASEIRTQAIKEGMVTMFQDGIQKVEQGVTTIEEVLRVTRE